MLSLLQQCIIGETARPHRGRLLPRTGNPKQFQKKMLTILLVFAFSIVGMVYLANKGVKTSSRIEPLSNIANNNLLDDAFSGEVEISDDYIDDARAKKILQEGDKLLFEENGSGLDSYELDSKLINSDVFIAAPIELNGFINELEKVGLEEIDSFVGAECHNYQDLSLIHI